MKQVEEARALLGVDENQSYMPILKRWITGVDLDEKKEVRKVHQVMRGSITKANKAIVSAVLEAAKRYAKGARRVQGPQ